jgi:putative tricarboxylic transport membrane protein
MSTPRESPRGRGELGLVALLAAVGVGLLVDTRRITVPGSGNTVGPRFFPYVVGGVLVVVAVCLAVAVWRGDRAEADESEDVDATAATSWGVVAVIAVAFAAHALLINVVGWPLAVSLMFATCAVALGARGWVRAMATGGILAVVVWVLFVRLLGVALPGGVLLEAVTGG